MSRYEVHCSSVVLSVVTECNVKIFDDVNVLVTESQLVWCVRNNNITRYSDLIISLTTMSLISVITVSSGSILSRERGCSLNRGETVRP